MYQCSIVVVGRLEERRVLFSSLGLRGAIAYALALNLGEKGKSFGSAELIRVLDTTTLIIVLFTIIFLGGSTLPLLKVGVVVPTPFQYSSSSSPM